MPRKIDKIISHLPRGEEGIFCSIFQNKSQQSEIKFREVVANQTYDNYLKEIANHHSVEWTSSGRKGVDSLFCQGELSAYLYLRDGC